jgi:hypothetical protein
VFRNLFRNKIFISILGFTAVAQFLIIQFGGPVFRIDNGMSWQNWLISIALGTGSIWWGFILRCLPDPQNIPPWMLGAGLTASDPKAAMPSVVEVKEKDTKTPQPKGVSVMAKRWSDAIHATRTQIRVTRTFRQRADLAVAQMSDPARIRQAQVQLARGRSMEIARE